MLPATRCELFTSSEVEGCGALTGCSLHLVGTSLLCDARHRHGQVQWQDRREACKALAKGRLWQCFWLHPKHRGQRFLGPQPGMEAHENAAERGDRPVEA